MKTNSTNQTSRVEHAGADVANLLSVDASEVATTETVNNSTAKLYSTPQAITYLERHPDAVFEIPFGGSVITLRAFCSVLQCTVGGGSIEIPMDYLWRLVSPKPKRERVRLGRVTIEGDNDIESSDVDLCKLPDGTWTVYAVKVER